MLSGSGLSLAQIAAANIGGGGGDEAPSSARVLYNGDPVLYSGDQVTFTPEDEDLP